MSDNAVAAAVREEEKEEEDADATLNPSSFQTKAAVANTRKRSRVSMAATTARSSAAAIADDDRSDTALAKSSTASSLTSSSSSTPPPPPRLWHSQEQQQGETGRRRSVTITRRPTQGPIRNPVDFSSFVCGLSAGIAQAGVFNPYDRALYLSVKERRPFLDVRNWQSPYGGFFQSLGLRAASGGLYFPTEHFFLRFLNETGESRPSANFVAGTAAGAICAVVLNPLTAIKYKTWGRDINRGLVGEASSMMRKSGGVRPFYNGVAPTILRDAIFGGCYTLLRLQFQWWFQLNPDEQWKANFVAAGAATVASGPFNYARNIQYATKSRDKTPSTFQIILQLQRGLQEKDDVGAKWRYLQRRLRIGWGTARVAMGMAFAHSTYDYLQKRIRPYPDEWFPSTRMPLEDDDDDLPDKTTQRVQHA